MEFDATSADRLKMREIPPVLGELLREIPTVGNLDCPKVAERFFPSPTSDQTEETLREDWKAFVEPGLHEAFFDARQVVEADLRGMAEEGGFFTLTIPRSHLMAWIHALNQARLALVTHHELTMDESASWPPEVIATQDDWLRLQMGFYERILGWLVELVEPPPSAE